MSVPRSRLRLSLPGLSSLFVLIVGAAFSIYYYQFRALFPFDDTFITFRYAYNLAHGYGLVWNPGGPHTEGYTNFFFVVLLAPFALITKELVPVAQWISILATFITGLAIYNLVRTITNERLQRSSLFAAWTATLLYLAEPYTWINAFSGMETSIFVMWVVLTFYAIERWSAQHSPGTLRTAFILATLAALTRPEGSLLGAIIVLISLLRQRHIKSLLPPFLLYFVLPLSIYAVWKYWYFGDLLPNSFYVKVGLQSLAPKEFIGSNYLPAFYGAIKYLLVGTLLALWFGRRNPAIWAAALWIVCLTLFYWHSALLQPFYYRFVFSIEVTLIILAAIGLAYIISVIRLRKIQWLFLILLLWYHTSHTYTSRQADSWLHRDSQYDSRWKEVAGVFHAIPNHHDLTIAWSDVGILPYYSEMKNIDLVGLNTTPIAHAHSAANVRDYLLAAQPDFLLMPVDHHVEPGDSCRTVVRWGHGFIGRIYPTILHDTAFANYHPLAFFQHEAYDILVLANTHSNLDTLSITANFQSLPYALPLTCFQ